MHWAALKFPDCWIERTLGINVLSFKIFAFDNGVDVYIKIGFALFVATLCGCSLETVAQRPVTGATARVRIDDGLPIRVYPSRACYSRRAWVRNEDPKPYSSPETYTAVNRVVKTSEPLHIDIPVTPITPSLYNEYYVEANKPVLVSVSYEFDTSGYKGAPGTTATCGPLYVTFTPRSGVDYEVRGKMKNGGFLGQKYCSAEISEVVAGDNGSLSLVPVRPSPASICNQ